MPHRSQSSSVGDNPLDPNFLPPHYREEYRLAIDALVESDVEGYYEFLQSAGVVDFLSKPEMEHIKSAAQAPQPGVAGGSLPELSYRESEQGSSSDTYWPLHSDLDAPGLDLGWPLPQHSFVGPTEVTTLVNPSDPDMPSIKEQARRLIKSAQQVIAIVMDMFTDVDLFADLLEAAARHVPVYILLDEQNAHHFVSMAASCKVNLETIHTMRVRTVAGITYFCRTGKSFKGQVMDRFMLADCRAVLSGNYSFMWSFEKIHRCIAHLFLGELVATFDEEFRILFAQSQPLVVENAMVPSDMGSGYLSSHYGLKRTQSLRVPRGFVRQAELSAYSFGDSTLPFRRDDPFRHTMDAGSSGLQVSKFASQQFRMQQSFLDQGRSMMASRQLEMNAFKRHSYAEGTRESYSSSRQYMKHRVMNNLEETESHYQREHNLYLAEGLGAGLGRYEQLGNMGVLHLDHASDSGYPHELELPGDYNMLSSDDLRYNPGNMHQPDMGRYGQSNQKRPTVGQAYACQSSPTHPHPPDQRYPKFPEGDQERGTQDPDVKLGMRSWRINSYLNTYEDGGEEGLPQPMEMDTFEETQPYAPEASIPRFGTRELPSNPIIPKLDLRPRFGKPVLPNAGSDPHLPPPDSLSSQASSVGLDGDREGEGKDPRDRGITKHESFRSRINPMLQRSSRLRSSLIFSSSKMETHSSLSSKTGGDLKEEEVKDPIRVSSIVAEILEKRRSISREPFDWNKHKKTEETKSVKASEESKDSSLAVKTEPSTETKDELGPAVKEDPTALSMKELSSLSITDPESRLLYSKELENKRPQSGSVKTSESSDTARAAAAVPQVPSVYVTEPAPQAAEPSTTPKPPVTMKPKLHEWGAERPRRSSTSQKEESAEAGKKDAASTKTTRTLPSPKFFKRDPLKTLKATPPSRRVSCDEEILTDATDAEKSELKKSRSHSSSSVQRSESGEGLARHNSNTSLNMASGDGRDARDSKPADFFKKSTQKIKGFFGTKGDKKTTAAASSDGKGMKPVPETSEEVTSPKGPRPDVAEVPAENHKVAAKPSQSSRYQSSTSNVLFSSNLRDDTKVILEQISANSQKNRQEMAKQTEEAKGSEGTADASALDPSLRYQSRNRFARPQANPQERDSLLKRIESMRKEKKVYSRFEMGNNLG